MPEQVKGKEQGGEPKALEANAPTPEAEGDKAPEATKAKLESEVAGLRAEMERIRGNNRDLNAKVTALEAPPAPGPTEEPDLMSQIGELPADEANQLLAQKVATMEGQLAEARADKQHAALTNQINTLQTARKEKGFEPLDREGLAELLEFTEQNGYSRLTAAWQARDDAQITEKLLLKGAAERTSQDAIGDQAKSEAAAPSLNAVGQGGDAAGKAAWDLARRKGYVQGEPA